MKRLIITVAALAISTVGAFAQGTIVFANGATSLVIWGTGLGVNPGGPITGAEGIKVGLYYNGASGYTLVSPTPYVGTTSQGTTNAAFNGRFNAGTVSVPGLASGATGTFQVRAWSGNFANYEAAVSGGAAFAALSAAFQNGSGGPAAPNPDIPAATLSGFTGMVVPEPATIALAALGLGALLAIRRRK
jgi:hypothetical protein